ncbi:MAG TPA: pentapeptide repeat-containing protein, partial [Cyclobacteriaceae bacterium]|nr:pentapeptide repeat-containing protein [Cyclobacteriaceae bacterium]
GGPGSGKSSFARIFAAKVSALEKVRVLFVPLHLIDASKRLTDEISRYAKEEGFLTHDPLDLDNHEPNLLIILDGLDELANQGRVAAETAKSFIEEVNLTLIRRNNNPKISLKILLSGRELVVQDNNDTFRDSPRQVLTLLPYFISEEEGLKDYYREPEYYDPENLLKHDYRQDWWETYGLLTGNSRITGLPNALVRPGLNEITTQPLLNYLVALSYTRGKVKFDEEINLNVVYADLVERVHEGAHNKRRYNSIRDMQLSDFRRILEEIALAAWHGDGRSTTVREIQELCHGSNLNPLFEKFQKGAEAGVTGLLAAFFFRQYGQRAISGHRTFVFTHKSFGEYLAACRIARAVDRIMEEIKERKEKCEKGWNERDALAYWAGICGPSPCTIYIKQFLRGEFINRSNNIDNYRVLLADLFGHLLEYHMPMEQVKSIINGDKIAGIRTFPDALRQSRNAEETLFIVLNVIATISKKVANIRQPANQLNLFGTWLRRIQGQGDGTNVGLAVQSLSYIGLPKANLRLADLQEANCQGANLEGANLEGVSCILANFESATLKNANLKTAYLVKAKFNRADLSETNLVEVNMESADLEGANLSRANLRHANLHNAKCKNANFEMATFERTNIESTQFENTNLCGTSLENLNLSVATREHED